MRLRLGLRLGGSELGLAKVRVEVEEVEEVQVEIEVSLGQDLYFYGWVVGVGGWMCGWLDVWVGGCVVGNFRE